MNKFFIFMILLASCFSYDYNDRPYYHPRYATNRLSSRPTPIERNLFVRKPFGRTPFRRPSFRKRFKSRLYRDNYYRDRSPYTPFAAAWLRKKGMLEVSTEIPKHPNYSLSVFGYVKNGQQNATVSLNQKWKWIARVMPTYYLPAQMICTAACVKERIFITAAFCIYNAKVVYTRLVYDGEDIIPIAFVVPSKETKEMFDDIGIIVVDRDTYKGNWHTVEISPKWADLGRPDEQFIWHAKPEPWYKGVAIGYVYKVSPSDINNIYQDEPIPTLYELDVEVSNFLCNYLYNTKTPNNAYFVPCYSPCNLVGHYQSLPTCYTYLSGLGHIVVSWDESRSLRLIGVATWAGYYKSGIENPPLPIGLSIPNSNIFKENMKCAEKIRDAPKSTEMFDRICT